MRATDSRRLALRVAVKVLALAALAALALALVASLIPSKPPREPFAIALDRLAADQMLRADWHGRRVIVLRRSKAVQQRLGELDTALADPRSRASEQPSDIDGVLRSARADFFVALDYDPDFDCPLDYVAPDDPAPVRPWFGGFHAPCSDSWFDAAGRVYREQRTVHNLRVPRHRVEGERLLLEE